MAQKHIFEQTHRFLSIIMEYSSPEEWMKYEEALKTDGTPANRFIRSLMAHDITEFLDRITRERVPVC